MINMVDRFFFAATVLTLLIIYYLKIYAFNGERLASSRSDLTVTQTQTVDIEETTLGSSHHIDINQWQGIN